MTIYLAIQWNFMSIVIYQKYSSVNTSLNILCKICKHAGLHTMYKHQVVLIMLKEEVKSHTWASSVHMSYCMWQKLLCDDVVSTKSRSELLIPIKQGFIAV